MAAVQLDARDVFFTFADCDVKRKYTLTPTSALPYPKEAIRQVLQHMIRNSGNEERGFLESLYIRLGGYQDMSSEEASLVERIEEKLDPTHKELSSAKIEKYVSDLDSSGAYRRLSAKSTSETIRLMEEIGFGVTAHA